MEYIILDIDGILTGTIVSDLTLSQQTIFYRLLGVAGKGHGRVGFIERAPSVGFTREALYAELRVYTDENRRVVDDTIELCISGDDPRIILHDTGVIEIIKWDKYQFIPKGTYRDTIAERKLKTPPKTIGNNNWKPSPTSQVIQDTKDKLNAARLTIEQPQIVIDTLKERGKNVSDDVTGEISRTRFDKDGE